MVGPPPSDSPPDSLPAPLFAFGRIFVRHPIISFAVLGAVTTWHRLAASSAFLLVLAAAASIGALAARLFPDGVRVIRQGETIAGLGAGALLVSTDLMGGGSIFDRSVILITDFDPDIGTRGFILNLPSPTTAAVQRALPGLPGLPTVAHGIGGPVTMNELTILHRFPDVPGSRPLGDNLFLDGDADMIRQRAAAHAATHHHDDDGKARVQVFRGHAGWSPRQLEGEIRAGAWKWAPRPVGRHLVLALDLDTMWRRATAAFDDF
uniref:YqgE/AlgH family protein n=1 Tax=Haptolina ericina TaxID=156174 RepID=A0A7S3ANG5_9EUKA